MRLPMIGRTTRLLPLVFHALVLATWLATGWLDADPMFIVGMMLLPYSAISFPQKPGSPNPGPAIRTPQFQWAILAAANLAASFWLPARTLHFFGLGFSGLFAASVLLGKIGPLPGFLLVAMSNLVKNWMLVFSFPIRLELSGVAAKALTIIGLDARADGNLILLDGAPFSVDTACMGLSMVRVSLLMYLFLTAFFEKKMGRAAGFWKIMAGLPVVFGLNLLFNLLRIVALVLGGWPPGTAMHEAVGLAGLLAYVFVPLYFFVKWLAGLAPPGPPEGGETRSHGPRQNGHWQENRLLGVSLERISLLSGGASAALANCTQILLAAGLVWVTAFHQSPAAKPDWPTLPLDLPGHRMTMLEEGVAKYEDGNTLIYTKPIRGFFAAEHTPLICWRGSGYEVAEARIEAIGGREVFTGILSKKGVRLPTAWWYSNGLCRTISQTEWRRRDLLGEPPFFLVNVTSGSREELLRVLAENRF